MRRWARCMRPNVVKVAAVAAIGFVQCAAAAQRDWPSFGGDWGNTRHSQLTGINRSTIRGLGAAWVAKLNPGGVASAVVVANGRMYVTAGAAVYALNPASGAV